MSGGGGGSGAGAAMSLGNLPPEALVADIRELSACLRGEQRGSGSRSTAFTARRQGLERAFTLLKRERVQEYIDEIDEDHDSSRIAWPKIAQEVFTFIVEEAKHVQSSTAKTAPVCEGGRYLIKLVQLADERDGMSRLLSAFSTSRDKAGLFEQFHTFVTGNTSEQILADITQALAKILENKIYANRLRFRTACDLVKFFVGLLSRRVLNDEKPPIIMEWPAQAVFCLLHHSPAIVVEKLIKDTETRNTLETFFSKLLHGLHEQTQFPPLLFTPLLSALYHFSYHIAMESRESFMLYMEPLLQPLSYLLIESPQMSKEVIDVSIQIFRLCLATCYPEGLGPRFFGAERPGHAPPPAVESAFRECFHRLIYKTTISKSAAFIMINKRSFHGGDKAILNYSMRCFMDVAADLLLLAHIKDRDDTQAKRLHPSAAAAPSSDTDRPESAPKRQRLHSDVWAFLFRQVRPTERGHRTPEQVLCSLQLLTTAVERLDFALPMGTAKRCIELNAELLDAYAEHDRILPWTLRGLYACAAAFPASFAQISVQTVWRSCAGLLAHRGQRDQYIRARALRLMARLAAIHPALPDLADICRLPDFESYPPTAPSLNLLAVILHHRPRPLPVTVCHHLFCWLLTPPDSADGALARNSWLTAQCMVLLTQLEPIPASQRIPLALPGEHPVFADEYVAPANSACHRSNEDRLTSVRCLYKLPAPSLPTSASAASSSPPTAAGSLACCQPACTSQSMLSAMVRALLLALRDPTVPVQTRSLTLAPSGRRASPTPRHPHPATSSAPPSASPVVAAALVSAIAVKALALLESLLDPSDGHLQDQEHAQIRELFAALRDQLVGVATHIAGTRVQEGALSSEVLSLHTLLTSIWTVDLEDGSSLWRLRLDACLADARAAAFARQQALVQGFLARHFILHSAAGDDPHNNPLSHLWAAAAGKLHDLRGDLDAPGSGAAGQSGGSAMQTSAFDAFDAFDADGDDGFRASSGLPEDDETGGAAAWMSPILPRSKLHRMLLVLVDGLHHARLVLHEARLQHLVLSGGPGHASRPTLATPSSTPWPTPYMLPSTADTQLLPPVLLRDEQGQVLVNEVLLDDTAPVCVAAAVCLSLTLVQPPEPRQKLELLQAVLDTLRSDRDNAFVHDPLFPIDTGLTVFVVQLFTFLVPVLMALPARGRSKLARHPVLTETIPRLLNYVVRETVPTPGAPATSPIMRSRLAPAVREAFSGTLVELLIHDPDNVLQLGDTPVGTAESAGSSGAASADPDTLAPPNSHIGRLAALARDRDQPVRMAVARRIGYALRRCSDKQATVLFRAVVGRLRVILQPVDDDEFDDATTVGLEEHNESTPERSQNERLHHLKTALVTLKEMACACPAVEKQAIYLLLREAYDCPLSPLVGALVSQLATELGFRSRAAAIQAYLPYLLWHWLQNRDDHVLCRDPHEHAPFETFPMHLLDSTLGCRKCKHQTVTHVSMVAQVAAPCTRSLHLPVFLRRQADVCVPVFVRIVGFDQVVAPDGAVPRVPADYALPRTLAPLSKLLNAPIAAILSTQYAGVLSYILPLAHHPPPNDALPACVATFMSAVHAALGKTTTAQLRSLVTRELPAITRSLVLRMDTEERGGGSLQGAPAPSSQLGILRVAAAQLLDPPVFPQHMILDALRAVQIEAGAESAAPLIPPATIQQLLTSLALLMVERHRPQDRRHLLSIYSKMVVTIQTQEDPGRVLQHYFLADVVASTLRMLHLEPQLLGLCTQLLHFLAESVTKRRIPGELRALADVLPSIVGGLVSWLLADGHTDAKSNPASAKLSADLSSSTTPATSAARAADWADTDAPLLLRLLLLDERLGDAPAVATARDRLELLPASVPALATARQHQLRARAAETIEDTIRRFVGGEDGAGGAGGAALAGGGGGSSSGGGSSGVQNARSRAQGETSRLEQLLLQLQGLEGGGGATLAHLAPQLLQSFLCRLLDMVSGATDAQTRDLIASCLGAVGLHDIGTVALRQDAVAGEDRLPHLSKAEWMGMTAEGGRRDHHLLRMLAYLLVDADVRVAAAAVESYQQLANSAHGRALITNLSQQSRSSKDKHMRAEAQLLAARFPPIAMDGSGDLRTMRGPAQAALAALCEETGCFAGRSGGGGGGGQLEEEDADHHGDESGGAVWVTVPTADGPTQRRLPSVEAYAQLWCPARLSHDQWITRLVCVLLEHALAIADDEVALNMTAAAAAVTAAAAAADASAPKARRNSHRGGLPTPTSPEEYAAAARFLHSFLPVCLHSPKLCVWLLPHIVHLLLQFDGSDGQRRQELSKNINRILLALVSGQETPSRATAAPCAMDTGSDGEAVLSAQQQRMGNEWRHAVQTLLGMVQTLRTFAPPTREQLEAWERCPVAAVPATAAGLRKRPPRLAAHAADELVSLARYLWLDLDYEAVARAAVACSAFFSALYYAEVWAWFLHAGCSIGAVRRLSAAGGAQLTASPLEALPDRGRRLLLDIFKNIGEPDSLYGVFHSPEPSSIIARYEHEGNWSRALGIFNQWAQEQQHRQPQQQQLSGGSGGSDGGWMVGARLGRDADVTSGICRALGALGYDHVLGLVLQGLWSGPEGSGDGSSGSGGLASGPPLDMAACSEHFFEAAWRQTVWTRADGAASAGGGRGSSGGGVGEPQTGMLLPPPAVAAVLQEHGYHYSLLHMLQAIGNANNESFRSNARRARLCAIAPLFGTDLESTSALYPVLARLQSVHHAELAMRVREQLQTHSQSQSNSGWMGGGSDVAGAGGWGSARSGDGGLQTSLFMRDALGLVQGWLADAPRLNWGDPCIETLSAFQIALLSSLSQAEEREALAEGFGGSFGDETERRLLVHSPEVARLLAGYAAATAEQGRHEFAHRAVQIYRNFLGRGAGSGGTGGQHRGEHNPEAWMPLAADVFWTTGEEALALATIRQVVGGHREEEPTLDHYKALSTYGTWLAHMRAELPETVIERYLLPAAQHLAELDRRARETLEASAALANYADAEFRRLCEREQSTEYQQLVQLWAETDRRVAELQGAKGETSQDTKRLKIELRKLAKRQEQERLEQQRHSKVRSQLLHTALQHYLACLVGGDDFDMQMFRVCSLWLTNTADDAVQGLMAKAVLDIQPHKWLPLIYQLAARLSVMDEAEPAQAVLRDLIFRTTCHHPHHCLYVLIALMNGGNGPGAGVGAAAGASGGAAAAGVAGSGGRKDRRGSKGSARNSSTSQGRAPNKHDQSRGAAAQQVVELVQTTGDQAFAVTGRPFTLATLVPSMIALAAKYVELAEMAIKQEYVNQLKEQGKRILNPLQDLRHIAELKSIALLTRTLDVDPRARYEHVVGIVSFDAVMDFAGGINMPRIVTCRGTDGRAYRQLVKGNDDMRQDAVMQQVFTMMNEWLKVNSETRKRMLQIRTYKIVPLSEGSGVLEWCEGTEPMGNWLVKRYNAHAKYRPGDWDSSVCRQKLKNAKRDLTQEEERTNAKSCINVFKEICEHFKPVMRHFMTEKFASPAVWFERRLTYTRSVAVSSIVGYVLGLGDRHPQNILLDTTTAEVIHIDLGVAFGQGKLLPIPETIPFRLTRDMVDGMGVCGVEGVFRGCCEKSLSVMRENQMSLRTILEVFLYDPLQSWKISDVKARKIQGHGEEADGAESAAEQGGPRRRRMGQTADKNEDGEDASDVRHNREASRLLVIVREKLAGTDSGATLSVGGQVRHLIQEAMHPENLCKVFCGWQPWV